MWPDRVSNPGPLTYEPGALPTSPCGPALDEDREREVVFCGAFCFFFTNMFLLILPDI